MQIPIPAESVCQYQNQYKYQLRVHWRSYKILTLDALLSRKKYMQQRHLLLFHKSLQCTLNVLKKGKVDILGSAILSCSK